MMRFLFPPLLFLTVQFFCSPLFATTYYSCAGSDPRLTASWTDDLTCTGANPANFTTAGDIFIIQAAHSLTMGNNWTLGNVTLRIDGTLSDGNKNLVLGGPFILNGVLNYQKATTWTGNSWSGNGSINIGGGNPTLTLNPAGGTLTNNGSPTINIKITITDATTFSNNGTVAINATLNGGGATATWLNNNGSQLVYGDNSAPMATGILNVATASNTVKYTGTNNLTIKTPLTTYYNLTIAITASKKASTGASITVSNDLTITTGYFDPAGFDLIVNGTTIINGGYLDDINAGGNNTLNIVNISSGALQANGVAETFSVGGNLIMTGGSITTGAGAGTTDCSVTGTFSVPSGIATIAGGTTNVTFAVNSTSSITGTLNVTGTGTVNYSATGATTIDGTLEISSATGTKTFGDITVNSSGTWNNSANTPVVVNGNIQLNGSGSFNSGTGAYSLQGASKTIYGTAATITITSATVTGSYTLNTITLVAPTLTVNSGGSFTNNSTCTVGTTLQTTAGAGTFAQGTGSTLNIGGTITVTTLDASTNCDNNVVYNGTGAQTMKAANYCSLTSSNTNAVTGATFGGITNVSNTFTVSSGGLATNSGQQISISGNTNISGTFDISSAVNTKTFNNIIVNSTGVWNNSGNSNIVVNGNIQNDNTFTSGSGTYTLQGGATKTISGTSGVTITNTTLSGTYQVNSAGFTCPNLTVSGALSNNSTTTVSTSLSGVGSLTQLNGSILNLGGSNTVTTFDVDVNSNTVEYNGGGAQSIYSTIYHHLKKSGGGTATLGGSVTVNGNITISLGTLNAGASNYNITLLGNWTNSSTFDGSAGTGKVIFDGTVNQDISGATTFENLEISNSDPLGVDLIDNDITINNVLTLSSGNINTGIYYVKMPGGSSVSQIAGSHVYGNFQKYLSASGTDYTFEVGGSSTDDAFVVVNVTAGFVAGYLVCSSSVSGEHGSITSSDIDPSKCVNRYWSISSPDAPAAEVTFTDIDITFNFSNADKDAGVNPPDFVIQKYDGISWYDVNTPTDQFANSTKFTNPPAKANADIVGFDFILGERIFPSYVYNAATGNINWNDPTQWIKERQGKIITVLGNQAVTGNGTSFNTDGTGKVQAGDVIVLISSPTTVVGTVQSVTDDGNLVLDPPGATGTYAFPGADFGVQCVPGISGYNPTNDAVTIGNPNAGVANTNVTLDINNPSIFRLIFNDMACANTLTHSGANNLTIGSNVTVKQPTNANTNLWDIAGGSATLNGNLNIGSNVAAAGRVAEANLTTGSLTLNSNLLFNTATANNAVLDLSGGACRVRLKGNITLNSNGKITPGVSSIFDYCSSSKNQTVVFFSTSPSYYNLFFNNTYASGSALLGGNLTNANVTGDVVVETGKFYNGGYSLDGTLNGKTFQVKNGATFRMTGSSVFPTGFTTYTLETGSYTQYYQDNVAGTNIARLTYGYLESSPQASVTHYFLGGGTTTINNNLTIGDGIYSGTTDADVNGATITVAGDVIMKTNSTFIADNTNTLTVGGNWTNNGGIFTHSNGTIEFNCSDNKAINGTTASTLYNVVLTLTAGKTLTGSTTPLTVFNFTETTGNFSGPVTMTVNGNFVQSTGTFTGGTSMTISGTAQFDGGTHNAATTLTVTSTTTINNSAIFTGGTTLTLNGALTCNNTSSFTGATTTDINANVDLNGTSSFVGASTINFSGASWIDDGGTFDGSTNSNTLIFDRGGAQQITGTAAGETFYNVEIAITPGNALSSTITPLVMNILTMTTGNFTPPATLTINYDFTQNSGTYTGNTLVTIADIYTINGGTFTAGATTTVGGNFILNGGTFTTGANLNVGGNWDYNAGVFSPGANTVTFNGSVDQTLDGIMSFNNLTMAQTVTGKKLTLNSAVTVTNSLTMTTGIISTATNSLTLETGASAASIGDADSYVDGPLVKNEIGGALGPVTRLFPVGKGSSWRPVEVTFQHDGGCPAYSYTTEVFNTAAAVLNVPFSDITHISGGRYWQISRTDPSNKLTAGSGRVKLYYGSDDGVTDPGNLAVVKTNSGETAWQDYAGLGVGSPSGSITSIAPPSGFSSFSKFTLANRNPGTNPLPIDLLSFIAVLSGDIVDLKWQTASELNNAFFTVEKTKDAMEFETVTIVKGSGNSNVLNTYLAADQQPYKGISYYRLKQTDFDGRTSYSDFVIINNKEFSAPGLFVFPNPADGGKLFIKINTVEINEPVLVILRDVLGNEIFSHVEVTDDNGYFLIAVDLDDKLPAGIYTVTGSSKDQIFSKKLIVK